MSSLIERSEGAARTSTLPQRSKRTASSPQESDPPDKTSGSPERSHTSGLRSDPADRGTHKSVEPVRPNPPPAFDKSALPIPPKNAKGKEGTVLGKSGSSQKNTEGVVKPISANQNRNRYRACCMVVTLICCILFGISLLLLVVFATKALSRQHSTTTPRDNNWSTVPYFTREGHSTGAHTDVVPTKVSESTQETIQGQHETTARLSEIPLGCADIPRKGCAIPSICYSGKCQNASFAGNLFKSTILSEHNRYRSLPVHGRYGGNMMELVWDLELENSIMGWLQRMCVEKKTDSESKSCRRTARYKSMGQNSLQLAHSVQREDEAAHTATKYWYDEVNSDGTNRQRLTQNYSGSHFTQLIWASTYRIGCALLKDAHNTWIGCNYYPSASTSLFNETTIFKWSNELGSNCAPGSKKGPSSLCTLMDEDLFKTNI